MKHKGQEDYVEAGAVSLNATNDLSYRGSRKSNKHYQ